MMAVDIPAASWPRPHYYSTAASTNKYLSLAAIQRPQEFTRLACAPSSASKAVFIVDLVPLGDD